MNWSILGEALLLKRILGQQISTAVARRYAGLRPYLNEFQRRLWLGAEAAELGRVAVVAKTTGVAADTVRRGRKEADGGGAVPHDDLPV